MKVYHGSNMAIVNRTSSCAVSTMISAKASTAPHLNAKRPGHIVSVYEHTPEASLDNLTFSEMSEQWLDFIIACRRGVAHSHDVVEGPMADDQIWDYVEEYMAGAITRAAFWELAKFRHPTHQMLFRTDRALPTLAFLWSYSV